MFDWYIIVYLYFEVPPAHVSDDIASSSQYCISCTSWQHSLPCILFFKAIQKPAGTGFNYNNVFPPFFHGKHTNIFFSNPSNPSYVNVYRPENKRGSSLLAAGQKVPLWNFQAQISRQNFMSTRTLLRAYRLRGAEHRPHWILYCMILIGHKNK